jgi:phage-related protein
LGILIIVGGHVYEILFYEDTDGNRPVENFIDELDALTSTNKDARIQLEQIIYCLSRLENMGTRSGEKFTKKIKGDIWELRPGYNRILFFGWNGNQFVLVHHFRKSTQKTPAREIAIAERRMENWIAKK